MQKAARLISDVMLDELINTKKLLLYILLGMMIGGLLGFFIFLSLDKTKGWNPYGWWFIAIFVLTIVGGSTGIFIYSGANKHFNLENQMEPEIISIIEKGKQIKRTIGGMVTKYEYPQGDKNLLLIAYHSILVEHHDSIHLLIENQLCGSAFALVRALYEPLYRAHWVNACATEKQIEKIIKGKDIFWNMKTMVEEIDQKYGTNGFWQVVKKNSWAAMNDYTHSGMRQISRRFVQNGVEPNYDVAEIKEVLDGTNVALLLLALFFFNVYKKPDEVKAVEKMILKYKKA